ncbi:hypothetical protein IAR55_002882 [Kwoniella newhampshirensis]|uniref:Uncharacterized protein n=1 Tax=Kwoniella newhampshirensis TaxID=1651941 RepID=A0AAW0Z002_9TREE
MSNYPHSASIASSLSTSPYAVQSNLENLINRSRTHPHPRRPSEIDYSPSLAAHEHPEPSPTLDEASNRAHAARRRQSAGTHVNPRVGTIQEATYEEPLIFQDDDDVANGTDERSGLLDEDWSRRASGRSSRRSYGATNAPLGDRQSRRVKSVDTRAGAEGGGNSRSRSKARTPPRRGSLHMRRAADKELLDSPETPKGHGRHGPGESADDDDDTSSRRGRQVGSRPLSTRTSSPYSSAFHPHGSGISHRRISVTARMGDDSSGDEGGDVARGLVASGGGAMFGGRAGLGMTPAAGGTMDLDPVEELDAQDLELPVAEDGTEVRVWTGALRTEFPIILFSAIPIFFTQVAEWSLVLASVISIGHLGTTDLAASSLASMTASVTSYSILQGLATALDTLLPAAWTSSDPSRVGLWTQRMGVVMIVSMIPMFVVWWNIEGVLVTLGQERIVAERAGLYLRWLSIGIPGYGGNVLIKK